MLGFASPHYRSPRAHARECEQAAKWLDNPYVVDGVLVHVEDLDAHLERARAAGAEILRGPDDQPFGRLYSAADVEGHRWMFVEPRD
jgi:PhnB protein